MEFWHCHKPDVPPNLSAPDASHEPSEAKGYGAHSRFAARAGVGFVDLTSFLLAPHDCGGIQVSPLPPRTIPWAGMKKEAWPAYAPRGPVPDTNTP